MYLTIKLVYNQNTNIKYSQNIKYMKTKTFLFTVIILFLLTGITSCDGNNDNDICTFNVDDPINDLEWLKNEITKMNTPNYSVHFDLYQNKRLQIYNSI